MENKIPLPTDNIYKFYALFGLVIFISCSITAVSVHNSHKEIRYRNYLDFETLNMKMNKTAGDKAILEIMVAKEKLDREDRDFCVRLLLYGAFFAICLMVVGFYHWHTKIQREVDKLQRLQIIKLERDVEKTEKEISLFSSK